jgi:high-affinity iron transporter
MSGATRSRIFLSCLLLSCLISLPGADMSGGAVPGERALQDDEIHRALGLLHYVRGDYALAVGADGAILDAEEYEEQLEFLAEVRAILLSAAEASSATAAFSLQRRLREAESLVRERGEPNAVREAVHALQQAIVQAFAPSLGPGQEPNLARGEWLYAQACAACHGADGRAGTQVARLLDPPPPDLLAVHLDDSLSPYQVFNRVTFGVPGTAMPAFVVLTPAERWDLAFFLIAMRREGRSGGSPCLAVSAAGSGRMAPSTDELAQLTDAELEARLVGAGVPSECVDAMVARLRRARQR